MDISEIISQLEDELAGGKSGLFKKKLDESKLLSLVEELKNNMPKAIEEAGYVLSQKEKLLETAKADAEKILQTAEQKAAEMLAENAIIKKAEDSAKKLIEVATKRSEQLLDTTKNNVDKILKAVEDYLSEHLTIVHDSRDELTTTLIQLKNRLKQ